MGLTHAQQQQGRGWPLSHLSCLLMAGSITSLHTSQGMPACRGAADRPGSAGRTMQCSLSCSGTPTWLQHVRPLPGLQADAERLPTCLKKACRVLCSIAWKMPPMCATLSAPAGGASHKADGRHPPKLSESALRQPVAVHPAQAACLGLCSVPLLTHNLLLDGLELLVGKVGPGSGSVGIRRDQQAASAALMLSCSTAGHQLAGSERGHAAASQTTSFVPSAIRPDERRPPTS